MNEMVMQFEYLRRTGRFNMVSFGEVTCEAKKRGFTELAALDRLAYWDFMGEFSRPLDREYDAWFGGLADEKGG